MDRLMGVKSILAFNDEIMGLLKEICSFVQENRRDRNADLIQNVSTYILNNYHDMNLNVSTVAEHFDLSASYLNKIFKDQTGVVLSNYITRVRLEESKRLLEETDLTISDIAGKIGYYNSNIFIRAFKKSEGVTPGTYRTVCKSTEV